MHAGVIKSFISISGAVVSIFVMIVVMSGCGGASDGDSGDSASASAVLTIGTESAPLPFDLPASAVLRASQKKVFAHYFSPYPISFDNAPSSQDNYATQFLSPSGEAGIHQAYGGMLRDRPVPRSPMSDPNWMNLDYRTEVRQAKSAGLDGFTVDLLDLDGPQWDRFLNLLSATEAVDPAFDLVLTPDGASDDIGRSPQRLADALAGVARRAPIYHLADGRLVVAPVAPEREGAQWWKTFVDVMKADHGIDVALVPTFVENFGQNVDDFAPFSYGLSRWGWWSPSTNSLGGMREIADDARSRGKAYTEAVTVQSYRPYAQSFWEAGGLANLMATWQGAIAEQADAVQMVTWNDYSENTQFAPSLGNDHVPLDLSSYYLTWYKTGHQPKIVRNVLYLANRSQFVNATPTRQTALAVAQPGDAPIDQVEVVGFLAGPGVVRIHVGARTYEYKADAGIRSFRVPLGTGSISAELLVGGKSIAEVASAHEVNAAPTTQGLTYYFSSSSRQ